MRLIRANLDDGLGSSMQFFVCLIIFLSLFVGRAVWATVLFEGYSKVSLNGTQIGFVVERYGFDEKKKEFTLAYLLKTSTTSGTALESLQARSSASLTPVSYSYTLIDNGKGKSIDATMKAQKMTLKIREGNKVHEQKLDVPKGAFLSRFLTYLMLQSPDGIKTGAHYGFKALAEEDGTLSKGEAYVASRDTQNGESVFKVISKFKGSTNVSFITAKGEVLSTRDSDAGIAAELVADPEDATSKFPVSASTYKGVFGDQPKGLDNVLSRKAKAVETATAKLKSQTSSGTASTKASEKDE